MGEGRGGVVLEASYDSTDTHLEIASASMRGMTRVARKGEASHIDDDRQCRGESAAMTECDRNVQCDNFDAHGTMAMADDAGGGGQTGSPRHDDAVAFFESHQKQVVQAS